MSEINGKTLESQTKSSVFRRRVFGHQGVMIGAAIVLAAVLIALSAPLIAPHDPYYQDLLNRLVPPVWDSRGSWEHILGTDHLGRDYLSRLIYGARISLLIGVGAALISGLIGTVLGVAAGYFGGRVDMVVTFMITVRLSMPVVLVALAVVAIVGGSSAGRDHGPWVFVMGQVCRCHAVVNIANSIDGLCGGGAGSGLLHNPYFDNRNHA